MLIYPTLGTHSQFPIRESSPFSSIKQKPSELCFQFDKSNSDCESAINRCRYRAKKCVTIDSNENVLLSYENSPLLVHWMGEIRLYEPHLNLNDVWLRTS